MRRDLNHHREVLCNMQHSLARHDADSAVIAEERRKHRERLQTMISRLNYQIKEAERRQLLAFDADKFRKKALGAAQL